MHNSAFAIPMLVVEPRRTLITLRFAGIIDAIEVEVLCDKITIAVNHNGLNWDILHCTRASLVRLTDINAAGGPLLSDRSVWREGAANGSSDRRDPGEYEMLNRFANWTALDGLLAPA